MSLLEQGELARTADYYALQPDAATALELRSTSALVDVVTSQPALLEQLQSALDGRYEHVLALVSCLDTGQSAKKLVDAIVDDCASVLAECSAR